MRACIPEVCGHMPEICGHVMNNITGLFYLEKNIFQVKKSNNNRYNVKVLRINSGTLISHTDLNKEVIEVALKHSIKICRDTMQGIILGIFDEDFS